MTHATGGLIQAADYNTFKDQLNTIWGTGNGAAGYGQTPVPAVAANNIIYASEWATLISTLNKARTHQTGSGSGITAPVTGELISFTSRPTLAAQISSAVSSASAFGSQGATTVGTNSTWAISAAATGAQNGFKDTNVTFASADQARYFFNCGGQINFVCSATDNAGTTRSQSLRDTINAAGGVVAFRNTTNGGRSGAGGIVVNNNTNFGYRTAGYGVATTLVTSTDSNALYSGYQATISVFNQDATTTNGANGASFAFRLVIIASADDVFGGAINLTVNTRADIVYPESTNLTTNSWGIPTISFDYT
jgi:hypothetical protein